MKMAEGTWSSRGTKNLLTTLITFPLGKKIKKRSTLLLPLKEQDFPARFCAFRLSLVHDQKFMPHR